MKLDTTRLGAVLAIYGAGLYDPDATLTAGGEVNIDCDLVADRIIEHSALVLDSTWSEKIGSREVLSPTSTKRLETPKEWGSWTARRRELLRDADPLSRKWLTAIFHIPADPDAARGGWNFTEMVPGNAGLNVIRRVRQLAEHITHRSIGSIINGLSGKDTIELGNVQVVGGTWDNQGQKSSGIDAVWAWLSLMGMTAVPATAEGTVCCVGSPFEGFIVLPIEEGKISTIVDDMIPQVDEALGTIGELAVFRHVPEMPAVQCWRIEMTVKGSNVTRRAVGAEWDDVVEFIRSRSPWDPDEHDDMTASEFRAVRAMLSMSASEVADALGVKERTVRRWEAGDTHVPGKVPSELLGLVAVQGRVAASIAAAADGEPVSASAIPGVPAGLPHGLVMAALGQAVVNHGVRVRA